MERPTSVKGPQTRFARPEPYFTVNDDTNTRNETSSTIKISRSFV